MDFIPSGEKLVRVRLTAAQATELDRRLATLEEDRRYAIPWAELKREMEELCP